MKHHRIFYGWWIVATVLLISAYASGVVYFGFTAFFEPIAQEFGWSYAQVALAASIRGLEVSFLAPLIGFLMDRLGPRKLIFAGATIIGLGFLLLSRIDSLVAFYGVYMLIAVGVSTCVGIVPMIVTGYWFRKKVSLATGIAVCGSAIGGFLVPLVTQLVDIFDWRAAVVILGLGALIILLPLSLLVRHKPEQYGYLPDGDTSREQPSQESQTLPQDTGVEIGVKQTLKSRAFWHIAVGITCHFMVVTPLTVHIMPYLSTIGINRATSSLVASAIPLASLLGRLSFGWFGDRLDKRWVTATGFAFIGLSMLLFTFIGSAGTWLLAPCIIFFGIGWGGPVPMASALVREYFGSKRLGTILGFINGIATIGSVTGPPLAGWIFDNSGSYQGAWYILTGVAVIGIVCLLTTPPAGN